LSPGNDGAVGIAFDREFEGLHDVQDLLGCDEEGSVVLNGTAYVGIEFAPVAGGWDFAGSGVAVFNCREFSIIFRLFHYPGRTSGNDAGTKIRFQGIEFALEVASLLAEDDQARTRCSRKHGGTKERAGTVWIMQENVEGVVGGETGALNAHVSSNGFWCAKQHEGLIEKVRGEIEKNAAAGPGLFAPSVRFGGGTKTVVGGFETDDAAEVATSYGFAEGLKIRVEAAVVVDGEDKLLLLGQGKEFDGFGDGRGEGLIDNDVFSGFERALGEGEMSLIWRGDSDELDGVDGEKIVESVNNAGAGKELGRGIAGALKDGGEAKTFDGADNRRVETAATETETNETNLDQDSP